jgi:3-methyladenine DNA glycosylase AlkD
MARYGLPSDTAVGVPVGALKAYAKALRRDQDLAEALWETNIYEARLLAAFVGDPDRLTPAQMDRWCRGFDNWGVCDTVCFSLFDRSPHAWTRVAPWARSNREFVRRAGFALMACLGVHDKAAGDEAFARCLPLIERGAGDGRNFVKKGVSWALRVIGRRSPALNRDAIALARRLAASDVPAARWVGKDALRDLTRPLVARRMQR